jgi:hypothetical protein
MSEAIEQKETRKLTKAEVPKKVAAERERDIELVTGLFRYVEKPGQKICFNFKKYAQEPNKKYELEDGKRYRIPRMVARHLNQNCFYTEYKRLGGPLASNDIFAAGTGNESTYANMYAVKKHHRTEFRSLEFMDDDINVKGEIMEIAYL